MKDKIILAFGAHPDDIEFGCSGTLFLMKNLDYKIILVDLTRGEKSIHGRNNKDAIKAARLMGVKRLNLDFGDKEVNSNNKKQLSKIKNLINNYKPGLVFAPYFNDPHKDHVETSKLISKFSKPLYYFIKTLENENYGVNISKVYSKKLDLLHCHERQAKPGDWEWVEKRNKESGEKINSEYGELFFIKNKLDLPKIFKKLK